MIRILAGVCCASVFLIGCTDERTIQERCDGFEKEEALSFQIAPLNVDDSLVLETKAEWGSINPDIPPKKRGESLYVLTEKNIVLRYRWGHGTKLKAVYVTQLPMVYERISDYMIANDSTVFFCSNDGKYTLTDLNIRTSQYDVHRMDTAMCHSMPFLGLTLGKIGEKFVFPMVSVPDANEKGNFLGVYDNRVNYQYGLGDFSLFDNERFAPYFDAPVMSEIINGEFFVTTTSSNGIVACRLLTESDKLILEPADQLCFSKQLFDKFKGRLRQKDLEDFGRQEESYVTDPYVVGLHACGNDLIRISKREQSFINKASGMKNTVLNCPWSMEILNRKSGKGILHEVGGGRFLFTNAFAHADKFYVLSNQINKNEIVYYAVN